MDRSGRELVFQAGLGIRGVTGIQALDGRSLVASLLGMRCFLNHLVTGRSCKKRTFVLFWPMTKGAQTRETILDHAIRLASETGLEGLTIGTLADDLKLSKSGLFAHFRSKEALQIQVLEHAAEVFVESVVRPALKAPRGEPRLRVLFEQWLEWGRATELPGGCIFAAAASEMDDRPGPVRDRLVELQREWFGVIAISFLKGVVEGHFREDADPDQFAQDLYGIMLGFHHASRLLQDPEAGRRARRAFERLLVDASPSPRPRPVTPSTS